MLQVRSLEELSFINLKQLFRSEDTVAFQVLPHTGIGIIGQLSDSSDTQHGVFLALPVPDC